MALRAGQTARKTFVTRAAGGVLQNADALPTAVVFRNAIATTVPVTVEQGSAGQYFAAFDVPATWVEGDHVAIECIATVDGASVGDLVDMGYVADPITTTDLHDEHVRLSAGLEDTSLKIPYEQDIT